ncbi:MAG: hypothetical protein ABEJ70_03195 [Halobacteriaceae archaeon]
MPDADARGDADGPDGETRHETGEGSLSLDETFALLIHPRRRAVLWYLRDHEGSATLGDLAEHIAAAENGVDVDALSATQRKRVYIALYQAHLPKMAKRGVVAYDQPRGVVELLPAADHLFPYLALADEHRGDPPRSPGRLVTALRDLF